MRGYMLSLGWSKNDKRLNLQDFLQFQQLVVYKTIYFDLQNAL
ncbi:hypothetical protein appser11_18260 [Actinobacillus pleuropneumoniae serovar 11 str. 56153]|nr:hypothetical protein appser9_18140 [Actinobacillus pleuropneumoniae serovar 9 str. CVJ13261]EFM97752.1 hypothetical protein appser11_18260 [Actinobacillus pleuropneumoniae serovar 11 str. 56153]EFM99970.1 hypothetical protein appser12_17140 [Actinobacillus pleuropneumoniae serovar 12 str. 1096]